MPVVLFRVFASLVNYCCSNGAARVVLGWFYSQGKSRLFESQRDVVLALVCGAIIRDGSVRDDDLIEIIECSQLCSERSRSFWIGRIEKLTVLSNVGPAVGEQT